MALAQQGAFYEQNVFDRPLSPVGISSRILRKRVIGRTSEYDALPAGAEYATGDSNRIADVAFGEPKHAESIASAGEPWHPAGSPSWGTFDSIARTRRPAITYNCTFSNGFARYGTLTIYVAVV